MDGDVAAARIAENNRIFRDANEQISSKATEYGDPVERVPFLCECPRPECTTIVRLTPAEYEAIRGDSKHFFTIAGHEHAEEPIGEVVSRRNGYVVVEKDVEA
ncbi:MAG TPA: hypothetical protein VFU26_10360 [Gaiellaceae bacterium]|nr:hypothetical protein [Gaiellaceae bacterium]